MNKISIIIPVLNEGANISYLLNYLVENASSLNTIEIIVVDGGSTDNTKDLIEAFKFKKTKGPLLALSSKKGRAIQMNTGAHAAKGKILYFLHADSLPPKHFDAHILTAVQKGHRSGCFRMQFDSNHWWLKLAGWLTALPFRCCRGGDQSLFITSRLFNTIGGYNEKFTVYEDNDLIKKLYAQKAFTVIPKWLTTSARCYHQHGVWKTQFLFWRIHLKSYFGADPETLKKYYFKHIGVKN